MIEVKNLAAANAEIDAWLASVVEDLTAATKGLATQTLIELALNSAQYSGDFAANWQIEVGKVTPTFKEGIFPDKKFPIGEKKDPFIEGDMPAMAHAFGQAAGNLATFTLGQTIYLHNSAHHHENYAWKIEDSLMKFRKGNLGGPMQRAMGRMNIYYKTIGKSELQHLRELPI
jgi:hypothetical protein